MKLAKKFIAYLELIIPAFFLLSGIVLFSGAYAAKGELPLLGELLIPLTIISPILVGLGFRKIQAFKSYGIYSIITGVIIFIAGGTTAFFFMNKLPYFGLVERINIGFLQLWMFITSIMLFTSPTE